MKYISDILFWISTGLLVPVIVLLILLFIRSLLLTGSFFGQYLRIKKTDSIFTEKLSGLTAGNLPELRDELSAVSSKGENAKPDSLLLETFGKLLSASGSRARRQLLISDYEIAADKDLAVSRTLAKMGPVLGLMGTLIPMGPALVGLSTGDIASMAYNMQVAFATTVVGLFSSAIGFITQQVKQRWYMQDLNRLEYVSEVMDGVEGYEKKADR